MKKLINWVKKYFADKKRKKEEETSQNAINNK